MNTPWMYLLLTVCFFETMAADRSYRYTALTQHENKEELQASHLARITCEFNQVELSDLDDPTCLARVTTLAASLRTQVLTHDLTFSQTLPLARHLLSHAFAAHTENSGLTPLTYKTYQEEIHAYGQQHNITDCSRIPYKSIYQKRISLLCQPQPWRDICYALTCSVRTEAEQYECLKFICTHFSKRYLPEPYPCEFESNFIEFLRKAAVHNSYAQQLLESYPCPEGQKIVKNMVYFATPLPWLAEIYEDLYQQLFQSCLPSLQLKILANKQVMEGSSLDSKGCILTLSTHIINECRQMTGVLWSPADARKMVAAVKSACEPMAKEKSRFKEAFKALLNKIRKGR